MLMLKILMSAFLVLGLLISTPAIAAQPNTQSNAQTAKEKPTSYDGLRLVFCRDKKPEDTGDGWLGTMTHVGVNRYMTAYHVVGKLTCFDAKTMIPLRTVYVDPKNDFAMLASPFDFDNVIYKISCDPFITGENYHSIGFAWGRFLITSELSATKDYSTKSFVVDGKVADHMRLLDGLIISGMSGGPIIDDNFVIHGMNNISDEEKGLAWSREMADLAFCK